MQFTSLPLLFAVPTPRLIRWVPYVTILMMVVGTLAYFSVNTWPAFPFFGVMSALLLAHGFVGLIVSGGNILWLFRYALVFLLVFGTAIVWWLYGGEVKVAPWGLQFQSPENTRVLVFAGFLSLCGSLLGWTFALRKVALVRTLPILVSLTARQWMCLGGIVLASSFAWFYVFKNGGVLLGGNTYTTRERDLGFEFGVFNIFHFIGIAMLLLSALGPARLHAGLIVFALATLVVGVLTGSRADFLPQAFLLLMLLFNPHFNKALERRQLIRLLIAGLTVILLLFVGYVVASFVAVWRSGEGVARAAEILFGADADRLFISSVYGHPMLYIESGNMMLGGLYAAIVNVREGITGLLWGESYLNYLLTSPPAFLGLPRPLGLEWSAGINGLAMSQGGIFEVAEAYWNFGFIGCFAVSFALSYFFGWLLRKGLLNNNYFFLTWYIVFGLHSFRSIWYQNFSYFRLFTIMLLVYIAGRLFVNWFVANRMLIDAQVNKFALSFNGKH